MTHEEMIAFCAERNALSLQHNLPRWHFVRKLKQGLFDSHEIVELTGVHAREAQMRHRGEKVEHFRATPEEIEEIRRAAPANPEAKDGRP